MKKLLTVLLALAAFSGCDTTPANNVALDTQKKLIGTWRSTSGWLLSFNTEWRITLCGIVTEEGAVLVNPKHGEGKVRYEIDASAVSADGSGDKKATILEFDPLDSKAPTGKWTIESLTPDKMVLMIDQGPFTPKRDDGKLTECIFDRTSKEPEPVKAADSPEEKP